jgi:hypothetical protein
MSRLWGGIHWSFDLDAGFTLGSQVAQNALDEFAMFPNRRHSYCSDAALSASHFCDSE